MPKKKQSFRLSETAIATLKTYASTFDLKNPSQALEQIIIENQHLHMYIAYLGDIRKLGSEIECYKRILFSGEWYCVNRPPKAVKLLTLDICSVCKFRKWKIPETQTAPILADLPTAARLAAGTPQKQWEKAEIYCNWKGGIWVLPSACASCKNPCPRKPKQ